MPHHWWFGAVAFVVVTMALSLWVVLTRAICKSPRSRETSLTAALAIFSVLYTLVAAELVFSVFVLETHGLGYVSLAAQRWYARYWRPTINSYGYRDYEPVWSDHALFVIGSSFVAGGGIEHLQDRMSGVLARKLGPHWTVATLAGDDGSAAAKYDRLQAFPAPDVLIVSDFVYQIDAAAAKHGLNRPETALVARGFFKPLVENSSLANWIYWRLPIEGTDGYVSYLHRAFASPEIFADYMEQIGKFMDYARKNDARLYFIIWPFITPIDDGDILRKVSAALQDKGANVIDLTPYLRNRPLSETTVNPSDAHPNARVHAEMAEVIFQRLKKDGLDTWYDVPKE